MKAAQEFAIGSFKTVDVPVPKPGGEQLLIKVAACGICGSDIPRIFELGTSKQKYPLTIGHEFGGEITAAGPLADPALVGKTGAVFPCIPCRTCESCLTADYAMCLDYDYLGSRSDGGFAEYCLVPSSWHFVETKNPALDPDSLALVEPCTVAQHAIRKAEIRAGNSVVIFGAGPIGIMAARWARLFGAGPVMLVDVVDQKVAFARERGERFVVNGITQDVPGEFRKINNGALPDAAIEGTGTGAALAQAIDCTRTFGTVVLMGNPHKDTTIPLSRHSQILRKELILKGMWNSHFAATPINEWTYTVDMLDAGKMQVMDLVTHRASLEDLPRLCEDIYKQRVNICKAIYSAKA
ncbi:MAG: galactitol-1-phosphate 5-dehydrogenase [Treponema sp.]|jgi:L-iditol 2-dehydrogenase|nr:galactitol-1-phosphate 5-dehydrogenase [Treponema sp.]